MTVVNALARSFFRMALFIGVVALTLYATRSSAVEAAERVNAARTRVATLAPLMSYAIVVAFLARVVESYVVWIGRASIDIARERSDHKKIRRAPPGYIPPVTLAPERTDAPHQRTEP